MRSYPFHAGPGLFIIHALYRSLVGSADVSCLGRDAMTSAQLPSGMRRGMTERPPRRHCGSPRAAQVLRCSVHMPSGTPHRSDSTASGRNKERRRAAGFIQRGTFNTMISKKLVFIASLAGVLGAALQFFSSLILFALPSVAVDTTIRTDVSCLGRDAMTSAQLPSGMRRGMTERPPRRHCGSPRAAQVLRFSGVAVPQMEPGRCQAAL